MSKPSSFRIIQILLGTVVGTLVGCLALFMIASAFQTSPETVAVLENSEPVRVDSPPLPESTEMEEIQVTPLESVESSPELRLIDEFPESPAPPEITAPGLAPDETLPPEKVVEIRQKLRKIGYAFLSYVDRSQNPRPGRGERDGAGLSWRVHLLPYLDEMALYSRFRLDEPWDSPHNLQLLPYLPEVYRTGDEQEETRFVVFTGKGTPFPPNSRFTLRRCFDGVSKTILAVYAGGGTSVPWTQPGDVSFDPGNPLRGIGPVNGRIEVLMMDVSPLSLPAEVSPATFAALVTPSGKELLEPEVFCEGRPASLSAFGIAAAEEFTEHAPDPNVELLRRLKRPAGLCFGSAMGGDSIRLRHPIPSKMEAAGRKSVGV